MVNNMVHLHLGNITVGKSAGPDEIHSRIIAPVDNLRAGQI